MQFATHYPSVGVRQAEPRTYRPSRERKIAVPQLAPRRRGEWNRLHGWPRVRPTHIRSLSVFRPVDVEETSRD